MPITPFSLERLTFTHQQILDNNRSNILGYFLRSTAPENVEDSKQSQVNSEKEVESTIQEIANHIYTISKSSTPELSIAIHGYNTEINGIKNWYQSIFDYVNRTDNQTKNQNNLIFIGYRWSSEQVFTEKFSSALKAMPILPLAVLIGGVLLGVLAIALISTVINAYFDFFTALLLAFFISLSSIMLALVFLRRLVYFRDQYRATNFGVPDLVEFIRRLDKAVFEITEKHEGDATAYWNGEEKRVQLNFLGHSMGGFVVTNTVRILSDVFYVQSVNQSPTTLIGNVFCLSRLVLASPDIPVMTILSGRANFLASSLRRFREAYLFSNEGDIALRLASTTANYFAFPSGIRESGYRLGNVAIKATGKYGILNLAQLKQVYQKNNIVLEPPVTALKQLFVTNLGAGTKQDSSLATLSEERYGLDIEKLSIADLFTYFDCTDYQDVTNESAKIKGVLSTAKGSPLNILDYIPLLLKYSNGKIDVHGGYFQGKFSQQLIYKLLFLGFGSLLDSFEEGDREHALDLLSAACQGKHDSAPPTIQGFPKGIKIVLSPLRYDVDIKGKDFSETRNELLEKIKD